MKQLSAFLFAVSLLLQTTTFLMAQTPVGHYFDLGTSLIHGYLDPMVYKPSKSLNIPFYADNGYRSGYYYDKENKKHEGGIMFGASMNFIEDKKNKKSKKQVLIPEEVNAIVILEDSFFVHKHINKWDTRQYFSQNIGTFKEYSFIRSFYYSNGISAMYKVNKKGTDEWVQFPKRDKKFLEFALKYFGHIPYLAEKIKNKEFGKNNIVTLIKTAEYYEKYNSGQKILYFDKYWHTIDKKEEAYYYAKMVNLEDSLWTLDYFHNDKKIYTIQYSHFFPHTKQGIFTAYYENGKVRQKIIYDNNKAQNITTYFMNGKQHTEYRIKRIKKAYEQTEIYNIAIYSSVQDSTGKELLDSEGVGIEIFTDEVSGSSIVNQYEKKQLVKSYSIIDGEKIYRVAYPLFEQYVMSVQKKFKRFLDKNLFYRDGKLDPANEENVRGTILCLTRVNEKGKVISMRPLNKLHPAVDLVVNQFTYTHGFPRSNYPIKLKRYKVDRKAVQYEVVIPIIFKPVKFRTYRNDNSSWHTQQMMMDNMRQTQQMIQNSIPMPKIPTF